MLIDQSKKITSVSELSQLLGWSPFRVKSLITARYIKADKINGRWIIDAKYANDWWASLTNGDRREAEQDQHCAA
jgi:hypothetical protein